MNSRGCQPTVERQNTFDPGGVAHFACAPPWDCTRGYSCLAASRLDPDSAGIAERRSPTRRVPWRFSAHAGSETGAPGAVSRCAQLSRSVIMKAMLCMLLAAIGFSSGCASMREDEPSLSMETPKRDSPPGVFETEFQRQERERKKDSSWGGWLR